MDFSIGNIADSIKTSTQEVDPSSLSQKGKTTDTPKTLVYPANLSADAGYTSMLNIRAYDPSSTTRDYYGRLRQSNSNETIGNLIQMITLPIPTINQAQSASYTANNHNAISEGIAAASNSSGADGVMNKINELASGAKKVAGIMVGQTAESIASTGSAGTLAANSTVLADTSVTAFGGIELRSITLLWTFAPKDESELKTVGKIIDSFHLLALPSTEQGNSALNEDVRDGVQKRLQFYKTPPVLMLNEENLTTSTRNITPFVMGPAGISNIRLNRSPNNHEQTFKTGDPSTVELEITFTELLPQTAEIYKSDMNKNITMV